MIEKTPNAEHSHPWCPSPPADGIPREPMPARPGPCDLMLDARLQAPHAITLHHALQTHPTGLRVPTPPANRVRRYRVPRIISIRCHAVLHLASPAGTRPFPKTLFEELHHGSGLFRLQEPPPDQVTIAGLSLVLRTWPPPVNPGPASAHRRGPRPRPGDLPAAPPLPGPDADDSDDHAAPSLAATRKIFNKQLLNRMPRR